jgi:hypothetical protein
VIEKPLEVHEVCVRDRQFGGGGSPDQNSSPSIGTAQEAPRLAARRAILVIHSDVSVVVARLVDEGDTLAERGGDLAGAVRRAVVREDDVIDLAEVVLQVFPDDVGLVPDEQ